VTFAGDGTVSVKADCNMKGGTYQLNDRALAIIITHSTMAMCPEESLEDRFVRDLTGAVIWFVKDGDLYLDIKYDTGTMRFRQR
jgi:heat shock protein HslJ